MKALKIFAIALVIALLACGLVACTEPTQAPEATLTPEVENTPEPTDSPQELAQTQANIARSSYRSGGAESGTIFVVELEGKWYWFIFEGDGLIASEIADIAPTAPEGYVLETDETNLYSVPENITIFVDESSIDPQKQAYSDARGALSTYLANISSSSTGVSVQDGTIFVVMKQEKWYSFIFSTEKGTLEQGEVTDTEPTAPDGLVLEENEQNLADIPEHIRIYKPAP